MPRKDILISFLLLPFYNTFLSITPLDYYYDRHFGEGDIHLQKLRLPFPTFSTSSLHYANTCSPLRYNLLDPDFSVWREAGSL